MTDTAGNIVWSAQYRAYGNLALADVQAIDNPLRFQGQYHDTETGLHYNLNRYYDPGAGRFIHQDPIGLLGGENLYRYAPNPTNWVDPWGLSCKNNRDPSSSIPQDGIKTFPGQPWEGVAHQEYSTKALSARNDVAEGQLLYRIGKIGKSDAGEAQFWAIESPNSSGYAARYGIPKENVEAADFFEVGRLKPGADFITRSAPPDPRGINPGGAIEVVVNSGDVQLKAFNYGVKTPYTGN